MSDFKSFGKIPHADNLCMSITQKIHGTNAQVYIYEDDSGTMQVKAGSRTRWITPDNDNYGFARFVEENKQEFIEKLGPGRHFGEWAGPGINSGEGLSQKTLFLFNWRRWQDKPLPPQVSIVPVLYTEGMAYLQVVTLAMLTLLQGGSKVVPGYMKPEGVVIEIGDQLYKEVFSNEEIAWRQTEKKPRGIIETVPVDHLLQPVRLEKLLSRDERYIRDYPKTLPEIISAYVKDLEEEGQISGTEDEVHAIKKALGKKVFLFVKEFIKKRC